MKLTGKWFSFLLVMASLLLACQVSATATPAVLNGSTAAPSGSKAPTATPGAGPSTYISQENGLRVHYPQGWTTQAPAQGSQSLVVFVSPDQSVQAELFVFPLQSGDTAEFCHRPAGRQRLAGADEYLRR